MTTSPILVEEAQSGTEQTAEPRRTPGSRSHALLRILRKLHLYLGVFTAPALIFFAFTGALQSFSLHETSQGSSYRPPAWIVAMAQLHKKQTTEVPVRKQRPEPNSRPGPADKGDRLEDGQPARGKHKAAQPTTLPTAPEEAAAPAQSGLPAMPRSHLPMKIFFLLISASLFLSTLTGIYMAYKCSRGKLLISGLLAAGVVLPLLLLAF
jgi:hypothetical protein